MSRIIRRALSVGLLVATTAVVFAPSSEAAAPPTVEVTPATALVDFQRVQVTGSGFDGYTLLEWFQCRGGAVDENDCDGYNADFIDVDAAGNVNETIYVDARIFLPDGTEVDCRTDPAGCEVGVGFMVDAGEWPEAALEFDPDAPLRPPVTGTVFPNTGLVDGQLVGFEAENLSFREETFAYLCADGAGELGERCDLDQLTRGVPDAQGYYAGEIALRSRFTTPWGTEVDCLAAETTCSVHLTWGFAPPPDRRAEVAVSFLEPSKPTIPPSQPPPAPTPAPPAAQPVTATPVFTG
jgi:hypothetical protein